MPFGNTAHTMLLLQDVLQAYCCLAQIYPSSDENEKVVPAGQNTRIPGTTSTKRTVCSCGLVLTSYREHSVS